MNMRTILVALCMMPLASCDHQMVRVTLHSLPEGAAIVQNGSVVGTTPFVLEYDKAAAFKAGQCFEIQTLTTQWASGATSEISGNACPAHGYNQQYTFLRPAGVAGASADAQVAAANQAARTAQYIANEQTADDNAAMVSNAINNAATNYNQSLLQQRATYPQYTPPPVTAPVTCTTSTFFGQLKTVCQ